MTKSIRLSLALFLLTFWMGALYGVKQVFGEVTFKPYKNNYIVKTTNTGAEEENNLRFQFSFYSTIFRPYLHFSYTQRSIWKLWEPSSPLTDHDYNPALFLKLHDSEIGYEHESNGMDGGRSRSWERLYVSHMYQAKPYLRIGYKHWQPFFLHENQEVVKYQGKGELILEIQLSGNTRLLNTTREHSNRTHFSYDAGDFNVFAIIFNGYGMNIIEFDKESHWYGLGVSL